MNLRSQKGATGTDVIIAITVIVLTIAVVSMIYVNTTLQSRNVTRTAGATRIGTNILENIEKLSYTDFIAEYNATKWSAVTTGNYTGFKSITNNTAFSTKIPKGYTVYLYGEPSYGSFSAAADGDKQFDLVRDIRVVVAFSVGDMDRIVDFRTSKTREITNEVNPPDMTVLAIQGITDASKKYYPIKYSEDAGAYIRTTEDDEEWYDYTNKKWAMVLVSIKPETDLFDLNGKIKASSSDYAKYVWIPKFFYSGNESDYKISEFAYLSSSTKAIKDKQELTAGDGTTKLYYNTVANKAATSIEPTYFVQTGNQKISGKWISVGQIDSQNESKFLKASKYGPCELH